LENFQWFEEPCIAGAAILKRKCLPIITGRDKVITDVISASWKLSLILALKRSLLDRELTVINLLKVLA
jgi:hypothetical protein